MAQTVSRSRREYYVRSSTQGHVRGSPDRALRVRRALGYRSFVNAFDLDMAFAPAEVAAGLERLFTRLGVGWSCTARSPAEFTFEVHQPPADRTRITIGPLPPERMTYIGFFPRTLLEAHAENGADLDALRREILLAFLRVTG